MIMATVFDNIPEVSFIDNLTLEQEYAYEIADFQTRYKEITGTTLVLPEASPWRILIMVNSSRTYQQALWIDDRGISRQLRCPFRNRTVRGQCGYNNGPLHSFCGATVRYCDTAGHKGIRRQRNIFRDE